jgi:hypothetical protein
MSKIRLRTDFSFAHQVPQIGKRVDLSRLQKRFQLFLSSSEGTRFIRETVRALGKKFSTIKSIRAELFQQGYHQFVFSVKATNHRGQHVKFCLILSKNVNVLGTETDRVTIEEHRLLSKYHARHPDLFVEPLVLIPRSKNNLVLYSSRLYEDNLEIDYKIDGKNNRYGLFLNSAKGPRPFYNFFPQEQDTLLEEMVKIFAAAYDPETQEAIEGLMVSAGDAIVRFNNRNDFNLRLVSVRSTIPLSIPEFVCRLLNYCIGLESPPLQVGPVVAGCKMAGYLFDEIAVYNGLVKAFKYKEKATDEDANLKAAEWMASYHQALERGELDTLLRSIRMSMEAKGLAHLPVYRHTRHDML